MLLCVQGLCAANGIPPQPTISLESTLALIQNVTKTSSGAAPVSNGLPRISKFSKPASQASESTGGVVPRLSLGATSASNPTPVFQQQMDALSDRSEGVDLEDSMELNFDMAVDENGSITADSEC